MDESNKLAKKYKINFSEENRLRKYTKNESISSLHKKAYLKNNNTCFNKSNLTKDINATNNIGSLYYNNLFLINLTYVLIILYSIFILLFIVDL